jgi:two-component system nitrate/nitrite response regulator NarL
MPITNEDRFSQQIAVSTDAQQRKPSAVPSCTDGEPSIRVLIVDEMQLTCNLLAAVLEDAPDIDVIGWARTEEEAETRAAHCDVVLVNHLLPEHGALKLTKMLSGSHPSVNVIVVGLSAALPVILKYIEAGVAGYVLADDSVAALLAQLRATARETTIVSLRIATALMPRLNQLAMMIPRSGPYPTPSPNLTRREREVVELIGRGLTNAEIAEHLFITVGTAKNHVHNAFKKLGVDKREDAGAYFHASQLLGR